MTVYVINYTNLDWLKKVDSCFTTSKEDRAGLNKSERFQAQIADLKDVYQIEEIEELKEHPLYKKAENKKPFDKTSIDSPFKIHVEGVPYAIAHHITYKENDSRRCEDIYKLHLAFKLGEYLCNIRRIEGSINNLVEFLTYLKAANELEDKIRIGTHLDKYAFDMKRLRIHEVAFKE